MYREKQKWVKKIDDTRDHTNVFVQEGNHVHSQIPYVTDDIEREKKQHEEEMHELVERN